MLSCNHSTYSHACSVPSSPDSYIITTEYVTQYFMALQACLHFPIAFENLSDRFFLNSHHRFEHEWLMIFITYYFISQSFSF
jgi:hypothetical protein